MLSLIELDRFLYELKRDGKIMSHLFDDEAAKIFIERGFARKGEVYNSTYEVIITESGRNFIGFREEAKLKEKEKWRDELNERAVRSAESSAKAAEHSAASASVANKISEKSKNWGIISAVAAIFSAAAAIACFLLK